MILENGGDGACFNQKVDSQNRAYTDAVMHTHAEQSAIDGRSYNINTGVVNLGDATKTAIMYVKNNEEVDLIIEGLFYLIGNSTGGSGDMLISVLRNPDAGTIISSAVDCEMNGVNRNFGSKTTLEVDMYQGADGDTITSSDGKAIESIFNQAAGRHSLNIGYIVLPKGASIGIEITPATGNTSLDVEFALAAHTAVAS